jgi:predicted nucleic acid-binding protein
MGVRVFWDTNLFIYLIEQHVEFGPKVAALKDHHIRRGHAVITSTLTLGELLTQPLRTGREDLAQRYSTLLERGNIELIHFDASAAHWYARVRAKTSLRQPDAIQMACAMAAGAVEFCTNDQRLAGLNFAEGPAITFP